MLFDSFIANQFSVSIDEWTGQDAYVTCINCSREKKMGIHREEGMFHCFVCGHSGNALQLIQETLGVDYQEAIRQLKAIRKGCIHLSTSSKVSDLLQEMVLKMGKGQVMEKQENLPIDLPSGCVDINRTQGARYLSQRGFERIDYQQYGLHFCSAPKEEDAQYKYHIVFPDYSPDTRKLRYWTTRYASFASLSGKRKKSYNPSGIPRRGILYGLFAVPRALRSIILVEGPLDVLALSRRAVALLSNQITEQQTEVLVSRFQKATVCLDNDANNYAIKVARRLLMKGMEQVSISFLPYGDPAEAAKAGENVLALVEEHAEVYSTKLELGIKLGEV